MERVRIWWERSQQGFVPISTPSLISEALALISEGFALISTLTRYLTTFALGAGASQHGTSRKAHHTYRIGSVCGFAKGEFFIFMGLPFHDRGWGRDTKRRKAAFRTISGSPRYSILLWNSRLAGTVASTWSFPSWWSAQGLQENIVGILRAGRDRTLPHRLFEQFNAKPLHMDSVHCILIFHLNFPKCRVVFLMENLVDDSSPPRLAQIAM